MWSFYRVFVGSVRQQHGPIGFVAGHRCPARVDPCASQVALPRYARRSTHFVASRYASELARLFGHHSPPPTARVQRNTPAAPLPLASKLLSLRQDVKDAFRDAVGDVNNVKMVGSNGSAVVEFAKKKAKALLPF